MTALGTKRQFDDALRQTTIASNAASQLSLGKTFTNNESEPMHIDPGQASVCRAAI